MDSRKNFNLEGVSLAGLILYLRTHERTMKKNRETSSEATRGELFQVTRSLSDLIRRVGRRLGSNHTETIGETFRRMRDVSGNGLTLPSPYVESERAEHRAEKRDGGERKRMYMCARVYSYGRVRAAGIIFGLNRTKFSSRSVSSVSYGPLSDSATLRLGPRMIGRGFEHPVDAYRRTDRPP